MKKGFLKRIAAGFVSGFMCLTMLPQAITSNAANVGDKLSVGNGMNQHKGVCDGYSYEVWIDTTGGSGSMTLGSGASFKAEWSANVNAGNFLARRGLDFGSQKKATDYPYIGLDYDADYRQTGSANGNSRLCVYGWFQNKGAGNVPLVEYYIIEDWVDWVPDANGKMVTIDGAQYKIFQMDHTGPTINGGSETFKQYFSVRQNKRTSGHITVSDHFKAWADQGWGIGNLYEVALNAEGWQSSGVADVKMLDVYTDPSQAGTGGGDITTPSTKEPKDPDANGNYITGSFETGNDGWTGRGDAKAATTGSVYYEGKQSLAITGRTDNWHGAAITLDPDYFVPGYSYSFSTAVLQKSGKDTDIQLTLQQGNGDSATYTQIQTVTAKNGVWTDLSNSSFTIPSGSSDMILYVEAPDSLTDIYLDAVRIAKDGTKSSVVTGGGYTGGEATVTTTKDNGQSGSTVTTQSGNSGNWNKQNAGLKNVFSKYFKVGTAVSANEVTKNPEFILKHFNSITPENELKPDAILDQAASKSKGNNVNPQVNLGYGARTILDFAAKNNIPVRGHTLIWHSQTPSWFFKENFDDNGAAVSKEVMDQRIENYIKNVFETLEREYPTVKFYAYDVANECFADGQNSLRPAGWNQNGGESPWNLIYGNDSYLETAFTAARKYAPAGCKLYYNDYNEYEDPKMTNIYNLVEKLYKKGILDGVGMQSHLDTSYPSASQYEKALAKYASIGCDVQVTELDVTCNNAQTQASYYASIVKAIMNCDSVSSLTFWGTNDGMSWRGSQNPLPFDSSYNPKPAYDSIIDLVNESEYGDGYTDGSGSGQPSTTTTQTPSNVVYGDANLDGKVTVADAVAILQFLGNKDKYPLNDEAKSNADVYMRGDGVTANDALTIQKYDAGIVKTLPESYLEGAATTTQKQDVVTTAAPQNVTYINESFESGVGNWTARGDSVSITSDSDSYYSGSKSVKVSGRTAEWNGIAYSLGSDFKAGNTYSFAAAVMQASGSTEEVRISLQYTDASGETNWDHIATADAKDKTWTKVENTSYTIPAGATDLLLYIETAESTCDLYVDSIMVASEGVKSDITTGGGKVGEIKTAPAVTGGVDISWIDPSKPMVAISFDDGAVGSSATASSMRIINAVADSGFHATFFYVGDWIRGTDGENEVKYAYSKGMEIANHTMSHPDLSTKSASEIRSEYDKCEAKLQSIIGTQPSKLLRLPYLASNSTVQSTLNDAPLITCAIDTGDWNGASKDQIVNKIKSAMADGSLKNSIVLAHETYDTTAAAMEEVIPYLKAQGWQVVTVSEMFAVNNKQLQGGTIYTRS